MYYFSYSILFYLYLDSLHIHHFNGFVIFHQADTPEIQCTGFTKHLTLFTKCKISLCKHVLEIARHIFNEKENHCRNRKIVIYIPQTRFERNALMKCIELYLFWFESLRSGIAILYLSFAIQIIVIIIIYEALWMHPALYEYIIEIK